MPIYVEIRIRAPLEELWLRTQTPELHERWDLRFSEIRYLPKNGPAEPQRFLYATRIGLGLRIAGRGESVGRRDGAGGESSSALRFWSEDPKSLIREGSGYWKYVPTSDGIRFLTGYDYEVRFGAFGRAVDSALFRPLMGWATAWSFDRLRLWLERGIPPEQSLRMSLAHWLARLTVAFIWLYHGLVPKLLLRHPDELAMMKALGVPDGPAPALLAAAGLGEAAMGLAVAFCGARAWPHAATVALMALALASVAVSAPAALGAAFNPVSLNAATAALAAVAWLCAKDLPAASRCLREEPDA